MSIDKKILRVIEEKANKYYFDLFDRQMNILSLVKLKLSKSGDNKFRLPIKVGPDCLRINCTRNRVAAHIRELNKEDNIYTGFSCGFLEFDKTGKLIRGLTEWEIALIRYIYHTNFGGFEVEKRNGFRCYYPHEFGFIMINRLKKLAREKTVRETGDIKHRKLLIGKYKVDIFDYDSIFDFHVDSDTFIKILELEDSHTRNLFLELSEPALVTAFNKIIYVCRSYNRYRNDEIVELHSFAEDRMIEEFHKVKHLFSQGHVLCPEEAYIPRQYFTIPKAKFPELELPPVYKFIALRELSVKSKVNTFKSSNRFYNIFVNYIYQFLLECIEPEEIKESLDGVDYSGLVSAPDRLIYLNIWSVDHFFNALGMIPFNLEITKKMCEGGLIYFIKKQGEEKGKIQIRNLGDKCAPSANPVWAIPCWYIFLHSGDTDFLRKIYPLIELNMRFYDKHMRFENGLYFSTGFWNDYSTGPKARRNISGIGLVSLIYIQKVILGRMGKVLKISNNYLREAKLLKEKINDLFWDKNEKFYYDYDVESRKVYRTPKGELFYGLDNLLPLFAGIPSGARALDVHRKICNTNLYGRYPGITTDLSRNFMDDRRLMIWAMTNWFVIEGLRNYGFHDKANQISMEILNACYRNWLNYRSVPEALDAKHGLDPEENLNLAGVGCVTSCLLLFLDLLGFSYQHKNDNIKFVCEPERKAITGKFKVVSWDKGKNIVIRV